MHILGSSSSSSNLGGVTHILALNQLQYDGEQQRLQLLTAELLEQGREHLQGEINEKIRES